MPSDLVDNLNAMAGIAAIINGLLLWPIVRSLKAVTKDHGGRIAKLERKAPRKRKSR